MYYANSRRQWSQKSLRQTKPKEICLSQLVENLGTQHSSSVMLPIWQCSPQCCTFLRNCVWLFAVMALFLLFFPVQNQCNMHVSFHLWTGPNNRTESQNILYCRPWSSWFSPQSMVVPENTRETTETLIDSIGRKQGNGGIWDQQPPRWIHTSVIFTPAWTDTVNNTSAHASGV